MFDLGDSITLTINPAECMQVNIMKFHPGRMKIAVCRNLTPERFKQKKGMELKQKGGGY
jgi:hypothetical protein